MLSLDTPLGKAAFLAAIALLVVGGLGLLVTLTALAGLAIGGRFTMERANASFIVLLCSLIITAGAAMLYRRVTR